MCICEFSGTVRNTMALLDFRLTIWRDLRWQQPTWHSMSRVFCCLHQCPYNSNTGRWGILPEPADSDPDPPHQHMLELWETEREKKKVQLNSRLRCDFIMRKAFDSIHKHRQRSRQLLCVVLGDPHHPKGWQHWVKTTHRYQTTLICKDMCSSINIITADCCLRQRG